MGKKSPQQGTDKILAYCVMDMESQIAPGEDRIMRTHVKKRDGNNHFMYSVKASKQGSFGLIAVYFPVTKKWLCFSVLKTFNSGEKYEMK